MLKRIGVVALLGFLGLAAGVAFSLLFPRYQVADALVLPVNSPHSASELVTITRGDHPGVRVVAHGHGITFSATGSLGNASRAVTLANRAIIAANNGKFKVMVHGTSVRMPVEEYRPIGLLVGLVAGFGTAFGSFFMPPKWRMTTTRARNLMAKRLPWTTAREKPHAATKPDVGRRTDATARARQTRMPSLD